MMGLPALLLSPTHFDGHQRFVKRLVDVVGAGALMVLLAPVFGLIAIAIKLTTPDLPVLYRYRWIGHKGREFLGYKFTTMQANAELQKAELQHLNEMRGPTFKIKDDPRVTRFGRILRKYSLNELPQLWCVLRGDMSLVGPRPALPEELAKYQLWHKRRLMVMPGMTCLWQVRGRNAISDFDDWVRMDLEYIDSWSLWLDIKILIRTGWAVVAGTGC
jgi:lipopolysaccharide/colanic/teichoic acid biosynthesis glycosyltransferase